MVDNNAKDALATILKILSLKPGIMHDQHEVLETLLDKLVAVIFPYYLHNFIKKISGLQIRSESFSLIQAPDWQMHQPPRNSQVSA